MRFALPFSAVFMTTLTVNPAVLSAQSSAVNAARTNRAVHLARTSEPVPAAASFPGRILSALGGAAIGAGVGFFASQVVQGDWDDGRGRAIDRSAWAAIGGSIGLAMGFSFPLGPSRPARAEDAEIRDRKVLRPDEWANTGVTTAWDIVNLLRPEWLRGRGVHIIGESADETIVIMLDGVRLGGISTLREVNVNMIRAIEFIDPGPATVRWGAGHSHGVILITAAGGVKDEGTKDR